MLNPLLIYGTKFQDIEDNSFELKRQFWHVAAPFKYLVSPRTNPVSKKDTLANQFTELERSLWLLVF
jgi:hypothetical protein